MDTYTIIKKGASIQHCINIPPEFVDRELEITIKPVKRKTTIKKKLEQLFEKNKGVIPFKEIADPVLWEKEQRRDWE